MKKQLPTEAITSELAESVFFPKSPIAHSNEGTAELSTARTDERVSNSPLEQTNYRTPEPPNYRTPERSSLPPPVQAISRSPTQPNGRTVQAARPEKTERYSFEIYPTQKERIEEYLYQYKRKTKQKISASHFIRTAIDYYFKQIK